MNLPSGTVTFLFTDIEGSTKLWEEHPETMRQALARHDALAASVIGQHEGTLVKSRGEGDSLFCVFARATDALAAACALQVVLVAEPWPAETLLRARIALHTGEADLRDGDYYGSAVNRCARLRAIGHGGQVLLSDVTNDLTRDTFPPAVSVLSLGEHRLRDLARPEHVFQLCHPELPSEFPPLKSLDNPELPNNLPMQITSFIGREKEMAEVKSLMTKTHLLTLTGSGGCGKTRLSLQVAAEVLQDYTDGAWLVELAPLADPALVPQTVAQALGVTDETGKPLVQTLTTYLKNRTLLLALDNCEHLLDACAQLADTLIRTCPNLRILSTSREAFGIVGETVYRVPSLSLPDLKQMVTPASLTMYEAVRLFIDRATAAQPDFSVTNANAPALASVCHRLDGIPLALELAASRVRALSVEEINAKLDSRFRLLTGGNRAALPRQQTLRALMDWSYDLLNSQERMLLARLSVFAGGWTLEAAETICSGEDATGQSIEEWEALDLLTSLVDKSLVVAEQEQGHTRYQMLETVRQYAQERLAQSQESQLIHRRHRDSFLTWAEEISPKLSGAEQALWLAHLETEHDNLRQALRFCREEVEGGEKGLRLGAALQAFWFTRGHLSEGREHSTAARMHPGAQEHTKARAAVLNGTGQFAAMQSDFTVARSLLEESLAICREVEDRHGIARSLHMLGNVAIGQADFVTGIALFEESLVIKREVGDRQGISGSLIVLGQIACARGDHALARSLFEESLTLARELGNEHIRANALMGLGYVACYQGDYALARLLLEESLAIRKELGYKSGIASTLCSLGSVIKEQGDYALARSLLEESLTIYRELGDKQGRASALLPLGSVVSMQGDYALARSLVKESLAISHELKEEHRIAYALEAFASLAINEKRQVEAARLLGAAAALREVINYPHWASEQEGYAREVAAMQETMGEAAFTAAWAEGKAMPLEQAIHSAMEDRAV